MFKDDFFDDIISKYNIKKSIDVLEPEITRKITYDVFLLIAKEYNAGFDTLPDGDLISLHSGVSKKMHEFFEYIKEKFKPRKPIHYTDNFKTLDSTK